MKKLLFIITAFILIAGILFIGCSRETPATKTGASKYGGTLRIADPVGPSDLGWPADGTFMAGYYADMFMDTLLKGDSKGDIHPNLATKYDIAPDLKSITLTLRQGVKFHDGSDWNAIVAKWNFDQMIDAKMPLYKRFSSVDILGDYSIRINISEFTNTHLNTLAGMRIVSKSAYDKNGKEWMYSNVVGTGPFKMVSYEPNVSIKGTRFTEYWQEGKPYLDAIEFHRIPDSMTRASALQAGEMDIIGGDLSQVEFPLQEKGFNILKCYVAAYCLIPDSANADSPLANPKVREAIDYAIDRDTMVKSLGYGFWKTVYQWAIPDSVSYINDLPPRAYNTEKAKKLLAEAGYPDGFSMTLYVDAPNANRDVVTGIQGYLSKIGIKTNIDMLEYASFQDKISKGWKNGMLVTARSIVPNMNVSAIVLTKESPNHASLDKTNEFYTLYLDSMNAKTFSATLAQKMVRYIYDNVMLMPIYAVARGEVMQSYVHDTGFYTRQHFWYWEPADIWLSK
jgi:peptide/nickel transport system substrate-binding protein